MERGCGDTLMVGVRMIGLDLHWLPGQDLWFTQTEVVSSQSSSSTTVMASISPFSPKTTKVKCAQNENLC